MSIVWAEKIALGFHPDTESCCCLHSDEIEDVHCGGVSWGTLFGVILWRGEAQGKPLALGISFFRETLMCTFMSCKRYMEAELARESTSLVLSQEASPTNTASSVD